MWRSELQHSDQKGRHGPARTLPSYSFGSRARHIKKGDWVIVTHAGVHTFKSSRRHGGHGGIIGYPLPEDLPVAGQAVCADLGGQRRHRRCQQRRVILALHFGKATERSLALPPFHHFRSQPREPYPRTSHACRLRCPPQPWPQTKPARCKQEHCPHTAYLSHGNTLPI